MIFSVANTMAYITIILAINGVFGLPAQASTDFEHSILSDLSGNTGLSSVRFSARPKTAVIKWTYSCPGQPDDARRFEIGIKVVNNQYTFESGKNLNAVSDGKTQEIPTALLGSAFFAGTRCKPARNGGQACAYRYTGAIQTNLRKQDNSINVYPVTQPAVGFPESAIEMICQNAGGKGPGWCPPLSAATQSCRITSIN